MGFGIAYARPERERDAKEMRAAGDSAGEVELIGTHTDDTQQVDLPGVSV